MLCTVALRRMRDDGEEPRYALRITGKTALGPSGTGGQETKEALREEAVLATLRNLDLNESALANARALLQRLEPTTGFTSIAEDVQIPFQVLERAEVYLFD